MEKAIAAFAVLVKVNHLSDRIMTVDVTSSITMDLKIQNIPFAFLHCKTTQLRKAHKHQMLCFTNLRPADPIYLDIYHRERIICSVIFHSTHHILHIKNIRFACPNRNHYHPYQIQFSGKNNQ